MRSRLLAAALVLLLLVPAGAALGREGEPDRVIVQHILIGFKKSVRGKKLDRTRAQAKALANELFQRATDGDDFDALVKEYTDDKYPGIIMMTNTGAPRVANARQRQDMVTKFGDVSFRLEVGEVGLASHHAAASPFGWHVIKRLE